jgi:hypothetical protein
MREVYSQVVVHNAGCHVAGGHIVGHSWLEGTVAGGNSSCILVVQEVGVVGMCLVE